MTSRDYAWKIKKFNFTNMATAQTARVKLNAWLERNKSRIQFEEVFVDNAYAVQYRRLMRVY